MNKTNCAPRECCAPVRYQPLCTCKFLSSYIEAVGDTQNIDTNQDVVFDASADYLDNVGNNFTLNSAGRVFTINEPGLYHVEWSLDISAENPEVIIGLLENGEPTSAIHSTLLEGNVSSGALINVETVPYTISLHNFGSPITLVGPGEIENVVASIRILKFADGAST